MAEIIGIASGMFAAGQALNIFAGQIRQWRDLSDRLLDLNQGLIVSKHVFERWQHKWEVNERQPNVYLRALFGHEGCQNIRLTLSNILKISMSLQDDVDEVIGGALRFQPSRSSQSRLIDERIIEECLQRIRCRTSWKHKFVLSVLDRAENMEKSLRRLEVTLRALESHTNYYLEREHPDIFSEIRRLPGRKFILRLGDERAAAVKGKVSETLAAQQDAELLHRASDTGNKIHIGLSVPRIHRKDFAFLLPLGSKTHEFLVRPVRITATKPVPRQLASAVPKLTRTRNEYEPCVVKPSSSTDGFELTIPPVPLLSALEFKDPLSTMFSNQNARLDSQTLYQQDQNALASGIAQSCLRLIGSQWLRFLDSQNVRWRRTLDGQWISMLTATPGDDSTTRSLEGCLKANRDRYRGPRDLSTHAHIFRIGLVITELCLKTAISYIDFDPRTDSIKIHMDDERGITRERDAHDIAADVDMVCNPYLGDMVFFCLSALQDKDRLNDRDIQGVYLNIVVRNAEDLDRLIKAPRRRGPRGVNSSSESSAGGSPRSAGFSGYTR
ncbi:hypothetical protein BU25DRAFT_489522 [Macroventuria anomochaeta]|uniref:Uncharacterized protein n=1 Tax=Macroventuria anomochaeta TaxID=301207 RepID=A0ACB6S796_9PLEO|nr:uncharacterized protein BU25DRAFT_489522 [Macroventuria anomochaeta]KAF2630156.1 hypothetical protein BU25DRAFT_489522 [Macroventuria anomochaeta]